MALGSELIFLVDLIAIFAIYVIVNLSLNLEFGYTGIPNFGKVLAVGAGAFVAAAIPGRIFAGIAGIEGDYIAQNLMVVTQINDWLAFNPAIGLSVFVLTLGIAAAIGGAIGGMTAYPAIKLRGDYLAITLLACGEGIKLIGNNYPPIVGGTLGVQVPDPLEFLPSEIRFPAITVILVAVAAMAYLYSERLARSPLGRMLRAVRDNETAASSLGKDTRQVRIKIIMISAALAAIGGALYAFYVGGTIAFAYDRTSWTFWPFLMILIGGLANNKGILVGTLVFVTLRKTIIFFKDSFDGYLPFDVIWLDFLLLGSILLVILLYRPQGIFKEKATYTIPYRDGPNPGPLRRMYNFFLR